MGAMRFLGALRFGWLVRGAVLGGISLAVLLPAPSAWAQSAADKATARTLATDGIKLFQAGRYAEALDKLQRAEALYDAPVHLLYIARAQVKLDKLVEAAETYRKLSRFQLEAGAAPAQKQAVDTSTTELAELEPKIPALRLDIEPANANGLEIRIDGERVPPAIVGVERPANPGAHQIQVWAPGFNPIDISVDVRPGEKKPVPLRLEPGQGAPPPAMPGPGPGPQPAGATGQGAIQLNTGAPDQGAGQPSGKKASAVGFLLGVRLAAAVPFGDVGKTPGYDSTQPISDFLKPGGGLELRAGVRFAKYFTGLGYLAGYVLKPGVFWDDSTREFPSAVKVDNKAFAEEGGIGLQVAAPRGKLGPFGELDFAFLHQFRIQQSYTIGNYSCDATFKLANAGIRLIGGVQIPVSKIFQLSPYLGFTGSKTPDNVSVDTGCGSRLGASVPSDVSIDQPKSNGLFVIGVGGDFTLGNDLPD